MRVKKFETIASDGNIYFVEARGYVEEDENDPSIKYTNIIEHEIYDEEGNDVTCSIDKDLAEEILDEIYNRDFS